MADTDKVTASGETDGATTPAVSDPAAGQAPEIQSQEGGTERKDTPEPNPLDDWGKPATADEKTEGEEADKAPETEKEAKETPEVKDGEKAAEKPAKEPEKAKEDPKDDEDEVLEELFADDADKKPADEAKKDDKVDLDKLDPEEQKAAQRNKTAKLWAERRDKLATVVDKFRFADKPLEDFTKGLQELNPDRYEEFRQAAAHSLVDENPEATFQRAYVMAKRSKDPSYDYTKDTLPTLESVIDGKPAEKAVTQPASEEEIKALTAGLDKVIDFDWRDPKNDHEFLDDRELAMVKTIRSLTEKVTAGVTAAAPEDATKVADLEAKLKDATDELDKLKGTVLTKEQEDAQRDVLTELSGFRSALESKLLPAIYKNAGLTVSDADTPEVAAFKKSLQVMYEGDEYEKKTGSATRFETFAYYESEQAEQLGETANEIAAALQELVTAKKAKDADKVAKVEKTLKDLRIDTMTLLAKANTPFKEKFIVPQLRMLGANREKAVREIEKAVDRVEITDGGSRANPPAKPDYESAEDVWGSMVTEAAREETLRAGA